MEINWGGPEEELSLDQLLMGRAAFGSEVTQEAHSSVGDEMTTSPPFGMLENQLNDFAEDEDIAWLSAEKYLEQYKGKQQSIFIINNNKAR